MSNKEDLRELVIELSKLEKLLIKFLDTESSKQSLKIGVDIEFSFQVIDRILNRVKRNIPLLEDFFECYNKWMKKYNKQAKKFSGIEMLGDSLNYNFFPIRQKHKRLRNIEAKLSHCINNLRIAIYELKRELKNGDNSLSEVDKEGKKILTQQQKTTTILVKSETTLTCFYCGFPIEKHFKLCPDCGKKVVKCIVCKLPVTFGEEVGKCSLCEAKGHIAHMQEWVKTQGKCPVCLQSLPVEGIVPEELLKKKKK